MIVKTTLLFLLAYTVSGKNVKIKTNYVRTLPPLVWPTDRSAEATRRVESSGFMAHIKYWQSSGVYSRVDVNDEVSTITTQFGYGTKYEIFYKSNKTVCTKVIGTEHKKITGFIWLPYFASYQATGYETVRGIQCTRFTEKTTIKNKNTIWAYYDIYRRSWIPMRYRRRFSTGKNNTIDYWIYDYLKFQTNVNTGVFNIYKKYTCPPKTIGQGENNVNELINEGFLEEFGTDKPMTGNVRMRREIKKRSKTLQSMVDLKIKGASDPISKILQELDEIYSVEATMLYLTSGLVEHLKYWKSNTMTRLDANNGAVTKINNPESEDYGIKYMIHPETTEDEANKKVCYKVIGTDDHPVKDLDIFPDFDGFERVGSDVVRGVDCVKLTCNFNNADTGKLLKEEFWVHVDNSTKNVVPVRYEKQKANIRHGYLESHVIVDYFNYKTEVNNEVFKVYDGYDCTEIENEDDYKTTANADYMKSMKAEEIIELDEAFDVYKQQFHKKYAHQAEHEMRKNIFHKNRRLVTETNHRNLSYKLALNKMSDRTKEEMKRYRGLRREKGRTVGNVRFPYSEDEIKEILETLPAEYDLRLEGVVGPVLNQEDCGSCWTFGTTAAVEGALARSNGGTLITLSNQALLDCSWGMGNSGCDGGSDTNAYKWIMKHGLPTVEEYGPYINSDGYCNIENMTTTYKIRGWTDVTPLSEQALKIAIIKHGPLSVSMHATDTFGQYDGGIFYDTTCGSTVDDLNHEVTLVGYGKKDGESFWIIRNSHGPYWGIDGHMHISTRNNNCGIMTEPTYVVMQ